MARPLHGRFRVVGTLVAVTPLHVGGAGSRIATDLPVALDGRGRPYLPGTSLAGALRAWHAWACADEAWLGKVGDPVTGVKGKSFAAQLWGFTPDRGEPDAKAGMASFVIVEDARVTPSGALEIRDGVGIDRVEGRAADRIKYDRQILPVGSRIALDMTVEVPATRVDPAVVKLALGHLLASLRDGAVRLGAGKTRGLGRVRLEPDVAIHEQVLDTADGVLALLSAGKTATAGTVLTIEALLAGADGTEPRPRVRPRIDVTIKWEPVGPVMVKSDVEGIAVDMVPLFSGIGDRMAPVLPGSSLKGALRSQAERILGTVLRICRNPNPTGGQNRFLEHLATFALAESLFGAPAPKGKGSGGEKGRGSAETGDTGSEGEDDDKRSERDGPEPIRPGLGAVSVDDCFATAAAHVTPEQWQAIVRAQDAAAVEEQTDSPKAQRQAKRGTSLNQALAAAGLSGFTPVTHVAIDRWTGGAAEHLLYSVLEPGPVRWEPIRLSLDPTRLACPPADGADPGWERLEKDPIAWRQSAVALLLLVLRDLLFQRIPIGFGGNRGLGAIAVESIAFTVTAPDDASLGQDGLKELDDLTLTQESFGPSSLGTGTRIDVRLAAFQTAWRRCCGEEGMAG